MRKGGIEVVDIEKERGKMHMTALEKEKMHMMDIRQLRERAESTCTGPWVRRNVFSFHSRRTREWGGG